MKFYAGDFICSTGYLRQGKTMNSVRLAYNLYRRGWRVVSNIEISFQAKRLRTIEDLYETRNSVIVWDEIQDTIDSRSFATNVEVTKNGIFFGKRGNILIMTTPHFGMLDIRFRQLTQYVFVCRKIAYQGSFSSVVNAFWYSGVGDELKKLGCFVMPHSPWYGVYDTLDESVRLVPKESLNKVHEALAPSVPHANERSSSRASRSRRSFESIN